MKVRDKRSCWQQILTILHTDSFPPAEWEEIYKHFLESFDNPYCIRSNINPYLPLRNQFLVRPTEILPKPVAPGPKTSLFLPPANSVKRQDANALNPNGRRKSIVYSAPTKNPNVPAKDRRASRSSTASSKHQHPSESQDVSAWKPNKRRESSASASTSKSTQSFLNSIERRNTCAVDAPIFTPIGRRDSCASQYDPICNPIKQRDSCASRDEHYLNSTNSCDSGAFQAPKRRNSCFPTHGPAVALTKQRDSASFNKRRNTCTFTHNPQFTIPNPVEVRESLVNPVKQPKNSSQPKPKNALPQSKLQNGLPKPRNSLQLSEASSDDLDEHIPLSQLFKAKVNKPKPVALDVPAEHFIPDPPPIKRKRGRPSLHEKAQQLARLEAEQALREPSLINQRRPSQYEKQKTQTKPLQKAAQKQFKGIQEEFKAPTQQNASPQLLQKTPPIHVKTTTHEKTIQNPQNLPKSSGKQPGKSRLQGTKPNAYNSPPPKKRTIANVGIKAISSETLPMPAHMPPTPINLKCSVKDDRPRKNVSRKNSQSNRRHSHLDEHNYNKSSFGCKPQRRKLYMPDKSDTTIGDQLVDDAMELTSPVGGGEASADGFRPKDDNDVAHEIELFDTPMDLFREGEEIERCLENFSNKTPSEIDHQLANTTEFFEKLPNLSATEENKSDLVGIFMGEHEELDYEEDDDDDVLSVAASWDGLEDEIIPEPKPNENLKATATLPELKPIEQPRAVEQNLKSGLKSLEAVVDPKVPKVPHTKPFRIPKLNAEELKTQPSVMRSLYEQEELDKKKKTPVPAPSIDLPVAASSYKEREEATAARRSKESVPVFAPPYRVPSQAVPMVSASIQPCMPEFAPKQQDNSWIRVVFGVQCMQSVDNKCRAFNCDHSLSSSGEVQSRLIRMDEETLMNMYRHMLRCRLLFQTFFTSFVDVFELRQLRERLLNMLADCRLHRGISAPLVAHAYGALYKCGLQKEAVACIMEQLWLPRKAHKFRDLTLMILRIVSSANWEAYYDELVELDKDFKFTLPLENLITILQSSMQQGDKFEKAASLILLQPNAMCKNETIMSFLTAASKCYNQNEHASSNLRAPGADYGPPSLIAAPSTGQQQRPPFRRQSAVHSFRDPPMSTNNFNGNNSFYSSSDYPNSLSKQRQRM
ncbi:protein deadlock isoform X2 [Drosophila elegans]|uniref:protein deadlock isoform X2 n=1 Tax=Drosophila elegans TaxID=30023 RepID=UPI0007E66854|nr:protein deadlock isoform X2 [Drosophila elegans]